MPVGRKRIHDKHLPQRVYLKRGKYYYAVPPAMRKYYGKAWLPLGDNLGKALAEYSRLLDPAEHSIRMVWERYKVQVLPGKALATQKGNLADWEALAPVFGHCAPEDPQPSDIAAYIDARGCTHANREIALLSHMYTKMIGWNIVEFNPCRGVARFPEKPRDIYVTDAQLVAWLEHARPVVALCSELAYLTGLRQADVLGIKLADISDDEIHFASSKTGKRGRIPLTDDLKAVVKGLRKLHIRKDGTTILTEYLVCARRGRKYTASGFASLWQKDMREFKGERFAPNDLRAKHASDLEDLGGDATKNLQHSGRQVTSRHYLRKPTVIVPIERKY